VTASRLHRLIGMLFAGAAALAVSACSAGQITQTSSQVPAIPGVNVNIGGPGGAIAIRDLLVPYNGPEGYPQGGSAPLVVRIFNDAAEPGLLVGVSSADAASVTLVGGAPVATPTAAPTPAATPPPATPPATPPAATPTPGAEATPEPTAPAVPPTPTPAPAPAGQTSFRIEVPSGSYVLLVPGQGPYLQLDGLTRALATGGSVAVTFTFEGHAPVTVNVPVAPPTAPAPRASADIAEHE
jgi:copper(I)-binding protein